MADKDTALAVLQGSLAIAGLMLVFSGFLLTKASTYETKRGDKFRYLAQFGLIPLVAALVCSWVSIWVVEGAHGSAVHLLMLLKTVLAVTAAYAIIAVRVSSS